MKPAFSSSVWKRGSAVRLHSPFSRFCSSHLRSCSPFCKKCFYLVLNSRNMEEVLKCKTAVFFVFFFNLALPLHVDRPLSVCTDRLFTNNPRINKWTDTCSLFPSCRGTRGPAAARGGRKREASPPAARTRGGQKSEEPASKRAKRWDLWEQWKVQLVPCCFYAPYLKMYS